MIQDFGLSPHGTEIGEGRADLIERCFGQAIAFLHYHVGGPKGWASLGFEFSSGDQLGVLAAPVIDRLQPQFTVRLVMRWLPRHDIITPRMARRFSRGRDARQPGDEREKIKSRETGRLVEDTLLRSVEGSYVRGGWVLKEPNADGGELMALELVDGRRLVVESFPARDRLLRTELEIRVEDMPRIISASRVA